MVELEYPLPSGAIVLDRFELEGRAGFDRWLSRWRPRIVAGELASILVAVDYSHALVVARPGPTLQLGELQLELELG
jgi:hypothetical protein